MARFSVREGRWITKAPRYPKPPIVNPYRHDSPDYAERTRETLSDIGKGMVRVDIGEPIQHGPSKA